ncbi:unnamed protein product [Mycena citricolor]|uniref:Uncharacterized protein n=1 Tax=Mycena citricolor TaxID=2018698 RepID=A0AAD2HTN9_9AGAR|nr:unnamed protein product [Mycena citricolor]
MDSAITATTVLRGTNSDSVTSEASSMSSLSTPTPTAGTSAKNVILHIKSQLPILDEALGELHAQTIQMDLLGGDPQMAREIEELRRELISTGETQKRGLEEIQRNALAIIHWASGRAHAASTAGYIDETLSVEVLETMNKQADEAIASIVDQLVDEQVAACLATHIPQELQDQVAEQQKELEELHRDLHNSESRRANAALRTSHEDDSLNTILKQDCTVPQSFPGTLKALFDLDGPTSKDLMTEYEIPLVSDSREWNLNRLMQFLGVKYQMVRDGPATTGMGFA